MISAIWAQDRRGVIGKDGGIPWHLPNDLKHFKRVTMGKPIVMGRRTWDSIGRPLPGRVTVVLTRQPGFRAEGVRAAGSLDEALALLEAEGHAEAFVVGGARVYEEALPRCRRVYRTLVDTEVDGDTFAPPLAESEWSELERHEFGPDDKNPHAHVIQVLERRSP